MSIFKELDVTLSLVANKVISINGGLKGIINAIADINDTEIKAAKRFKETDSLSLLENLKKCDRAVDIKQLLNKTVCTFKDLKWLFYKGAIFSHHDNSTECKLTKVYLNTECVTINGSMLNVDELIKKFPKYTLDGVNWKLTKDFKIP